VAEQLKIVIDAEISKAVSDFKSLNSELKKTEAAAQSFAQSLNKPLVLKFDAEAVKRGLDNIKNFKPVSISVIPDVKPVQLQSVKPIIYPVLPDVRPVDLPNIKPVKIQVIPEVLPIPTQVAKPISVKVIPDVQPIPQAKPLILQVIPDVKPIPTQQVKPVLFPVIPDVKPVTLPTLKPVPLPIIPEFKEVPKPTVKPIVIPVVADDKQVFKLAQTIETLQAKIGARKSFITVETDITKIAAYNKEIQSLEKEVERLKNIGRSGFENFIVPNQAIRSVKTLEDRVRAFGGGVKTFIPPVISSFEKLPVAIGKAATSLQRLPQSSGQATFALLNLGRVVQDAPFGFLGIANNLNPLLESFQRLRATSGTTGGALKALGSSLLGAGGIGFALSAVSSLLVVFGDRLFGAGKKAEDAAFKLKSSFDIIGESTAGVDGDIARVEALVAAFKDTSSFEKQKRILTELKGINESYFGALEAGKVTFQQIAAAANEYTNALIANAVVKGFTDELSRISNELSKQKSALRPLAIAYSDLQKQLAQIKDPGARERQRSTNKATLEFAKQLEVVEGLQVEFIRLKKEIGEAAVEALNFKPLSGVSKSIKDDTDKILAQARAFVKQFGEIFVLPDLEVSFTNTEKIVKQKAIDLLKNVDSFLKGNVKALQLRLPVQTDFDLLPIPTEGISKEIEQNFLKSFGGKVLEVPINFKPDLTLAKGSLDNIDKKLDLKQKFTIFGDLGFKEFSKIDFTNINKGLEQGTKLFNQMLEVATTLQQSIGQGLAGAFNAVFDSILEGKNVFKALGNAIKQLIVDTIKAVAQMLILKAVTSLIFPGAGAAGGAGRLFGQAALPGSANFGGIGSRAFNNVLNIVVAGRISGQDILLSGQRTSNSIVR
jgi:hypothetical protein